MCLVINRVRVLGSGPHTPTQLFWKYPRAASAFMLLWDSWKGAGSCLVEYWFIKYLARKTWRYMLFKGKAFRKARSLWNIIFKCVRSAIGFVAVVVIVVFASLQGKTSAELENIKSKVVELETMVESLRKNIVELETAIQHWTTIAGKIRSPGWISYKTYYIGSHWNRH